ncbi:MAG: D-aminoacyl-tRNA deacylase [Nanobdellota archaeon]
MDIAIIVSEKDKAGMNIKEYLGGLDNLYTIKEDPVGYDPKEHDEELIIFATKHASRNGRPAFSCHVSGNWGSADLGGKEGSFSLAPALLLKETMSKLKRYSDEREIFQEVTHHGPSTEKLSMFIEIGSSEEEWIKDENGRKIASVIKELLEMLEPFEDYSGFARWYRQEHPDIKTALGIGGLHHMPSFDRENLAVGHCCAKYDLFDLTEETLERAMKASKEDIDIIAVDWKGLGKEKQRIKEILENKNWEKTKKL